MILGHMLLLGAAVTSSGMADAAPLDLTTVQVFARGSIHGDHSDYQGTTVAGDTINLSDFDIAGSLIARHSVAFRRGRVDGDIRSPDQHLDQVSGDFAENLDDETWTRFDRQLDALDQRVSSMPATIQPVVTQLTLPDQSVTLVRVDASRALDVVDLPDDLFRSSLPHYVRLVMNGDAGARLVVRIHGESPSLQNVAFSLLGGLTPNQILFAFPDARDLLITSSGGAVGPEGENLGIPASILAPQAELRLAAARVTGQVFARDITSIDGLPSAQINRISDASHSPSLLQELTYMQDRGQSEEAIGPDNRPILRRLY